MSTFRILYMRESRLDRAEVLNGLDLLEVIDRASDRVGTRTAEIWSEQGKVGIIGPMPRRQRPPDDRLFDQRESEIADIMTARLRLTP